MIDVLKQVVWVSFNIGLGIAVATTPRLIVPIFILLLCLIGLIKNRHNLTKEDNTGEDAV